MLCRSVRALLLLCPVLLAASLASGCLDVRDFEGPWSGSRVGDNQLLREGFAEQASAQLTVEDISLRSLSATLTIDGLFDNAPVVPIPGAEADVLTSMSFDGSPARVFMAFVDTVDGGGQAMVMVALFDDPRLVVRILRGGSMPLYGIFSLTRGAQNGAVAASGPGSWR